MTDVCIYTANFGGYDDPHPQVEQDIDVEWHYYDDTSSDPPLPWQGHRVEPMYDDMNMAAKWHKTHPPARPFSIWIDASMEVISPSFAREAIVQAQAGAVVTAWNHPRRGCIYTEAIASVGYEAQDGKYDAAALEAQVDHYRAEGYPPHAGLYACGTIVWTPEAWPIGRDWMAECVRWSVQDQLSFPVVCWRLGIKPATFPIPMLPSRYNRRLGYFQNEWLRIHDHRKGQL